MNNFNLTQKMNQIINQLIKDNKSLTQLTKNIKVSKPTMLKYLNQLEDVGLINSYIKITKFGREKWYRISEYSQIISINPKKGIINFKIDEPLNHNNPLIGQIPQMEFRKHAKTYLEQINENFKLPVIIIIYGSIARNQGTAKSDLDILFLIKDKWNKDLKNIIMEALYQGAVETQLQAKPLFKTLDEFIKSNETITKNIKKDGIIIKDSLDSELLWRTMTRYWSISI